MRFRSLLAVASAALLFGVVTVTPGRVLAQAEPGWVAAKLVATGLDAGVVTTFEALLHDEIRSQLRVPLRLASKSEPCGDLTCAGPLGKVEGATVVVYGNLATLGADILVKVGFFDVASDKVMDSHKMTVDKVEDLALVAERIAKAVAEGRSIEETAALGTVSAREVPPARRREGDRGLALNVAGIAPLVKSYADADFGVQVGISYWFETNDFVIEPRLGFRFSTNWEPEDGGVFAEVPLEIAGYYVFTRTDIAPFLGGSLGVRYAWEETVLRQTTGEVLKEESKDEKSAHGWGFGGTVRAGVLLMRTYAMRVAISVDYGIGYLEQIHTSMPQSLTFGVSAMF